VLALKLFLVPSLICLISLASRRWGPAVAGWLSGFPVISAPVLFILGTEQGVAFAAQAAAATLCSVAAVLVFLISYAWLAVRSNWIVSVLAALAAYALALIVLYAVQTSVAVSAVLLYSAIWLAPRCFPHVGHGGPSPPLGALEIGLRMAVAAALVLVLTSFAADLGTRWSGLFAMFPVIGIVLAVSSHRHAGAGFTVRLLRGMMFGFYAFTTFCLVLALALGPMGLKAGFCLALGSAVLTQGVVIRLLRSGRLDRPRERQPG
jgi:hypothetical protein